MSSVDNQPIRYWKGNAIYLCHYFTAALVLGVVVVLVLSAAKFPLFWLTFSPLAFVRGALWQPFTYIFVNPMNFFTPFLLLCFPAWGTEVEKYLGRKFFVGLLLALIFLPVVFYLALYPLGFVGGTEGVYNVTIGLLIAFATLYPNMDYFGGWVPLKYFAAFCVACGSIVYLPNHDWIGLALLWLTCGLSFGMVRNARGLFDFQLRLPAWLRGGPKLRVVPRPETGYTPPPVSKAEGEMDALLDKIARNGLGSLTAAERERLEKARQEMLRKEQ